jgi:SAM-dependent methyltransferase
MIADREATSTQEVATNWFVDSARLGAVAAADEGIISEIISAGDYSDIPADQVPKLLEALKSRPWRDVVQEFYEVENPWLYRIVTDPARSMALELLDLSSGCACLDVGSGWGQLSIPMGQMGCRVVSLDLTIDRLKVLKQIARQEGARLDLVKGNILSFPFHENAFDLVVFNGSLEWVGMGRSEGQTIRECQVAALKNARKAVRRGGLVCVGIENSLGLKYLMGARDDHTGLSGYSFRDDAAATAMLRDAGQNRQLAQTWGLAQLRRMAEEAGLSVRSVYGCFPDYKLPRHLIPVAEVDQFLLTRPMDWREHHGDKGEAIADQESVAAAYKQFAENGIAQWVCPSYFMILVKA